MFLIIEPFSGSVPDYEVGAKAEGVLSAVVSKLTNPNNLSPTRHGHRLAPMAVLFYDLKLARLFERLRPTRNIRLGIELAHGVVRRQFFKQLRNASGATRQDEIRSNLAQWFKNKATQVGTRMGQCQVFGRADLIVKSD